MNWREIETVKLFWEKNWEGQCWKLCWWLVPVESATARMKVGPDDTITEATGAEAKDGVAAETEVKDGAGAGAKAWAEAIAVAGAVTKAVAEAETVAEALVEAGAGANVFDGSSEDAASTERNVF